MASSDLLRGRHPDNVPNADGHGTEMLKSSLVYFPYRLRVRLTISGHQKRRAANVPEVDGHGTLLIILESQCPRSLTI